MLYNLKTVTLGDDFWMSLFDPCYGTFEEKKINDIFSNATPTLSHVKLKYTFIYSKYNDPERMKEGFLIPLASVLFSCNGSISHVSVVD